MTLLVDCMMVNTDDYAVTFQIRRIQKWLERTQAPMQIREVEFYAVNAEKLADPWVWATTEQALIHRLPAIYVIKGAGGFAGGNAEARTAVVGDTFIHGVTWKERYKDGIRPEPPYWGKRDPQCGSFLHEMGHLNPEFVHESGGIMYEWWKFPFVGWPGQSKLRVLWNGLRWKFGF